MSKKKTKKSEATVAAPVTSKKSRRFLAAALLSGVVLVLGAATAGAFQIAQRPEQDFVQNFHIAGLDFSELQSFDDAASALELRADHFLGTPAVFSSDRGSLTVALKDAGVSIDVTAATTALRSYMSESSVLDKVVTTLFGSDLVVPVNVDETLLKNAFAGSGVEQGMKNASFAMEGTKLVLQTEQIGYGVDTTTLTATLQKFWNEGTVVEGTDIPLLTREPTVRTADLQPLMAEAQTASSISFTLTDDYGNEYAMPLSAHMDWLIPGSENTFGIAQDAFITTVQNELAPNVEEDPASAVITQNEDGTYAFEGSARFGQTIDTLALLDTVETTLQNALTTPETVTTLSIPVTKVMPEITVPDSLKALGVKELVGVGYSDFSGSPSGRVHNITEGINQFNGVLIQQGEEFSFMEHLSPVDAEHGFLPELVIKGDETIPEYGGGMCQVSSTMFRAALYSGLPITARTNHSYAVSYYARPFGYGLDATVYDPSPDLKFLNDTPGALLVQSYIEGNSAYYIFYGTNDGRRVTMQGPSVYGYMSIPPDVVTYTDELAPGERHLKDHGHQGFQVDWIRTITKADGTEASETIHSYYQARPEKWEEGKAEEMP